MNRMRSIPLILIMSFIPTLFAAPKLIDIEVKGSAGTIEVEPEHIALEPHEPYVLVIMNENNFPVLLSYGEFGQRIATQYLNGIANVNQDSFTLPAASKITWNIITQNAGIFHMSASQTSLGLRSKDISIVVGSESAPTKENSVSEVSEVTYGYLPKRFMISNG